jgi:methylated-DNA-protein-cysteine methyltransferase related protein
MINGLFKKIYDMVYKIPYGKVSTYKQIATLVGYPHATQRVGFALYQSKDDNLPTHRVVNRFGYCSSSFKHGGNRMQQVLLEREGVVFKNGKVDLNKFLWSGK